MVTAFAVGMIDTAGDSFSPRDSVAISTDVAAPVPEGVMMDPPVHRDSRTRRSGAGEWIRCQVILCAGNDIKSAEQAGKLVQRNAARGHFAQGMSMLRPAGPNRPTDGSLRNPGDQN